MLKTDSTPAPAALFLVFLCIPSQLGNTGFKNLCRSSGSLGSRSSSRYGGGGSRESKSENSKDGLKLHDGDDGSDGYRVA